MSQYRTRDIVCPMCDGNMRDPQNLAHICPVCCGAGEMPAIEPVTPPRRRKRLHSNGDRA